MNGSLGRAQSTAASTTPGLSLGPIEGYVTNRLDELLDHEVELAELLREAYRRGLEDAGVTIADLALRLGR